MMRLFENIAVLPLRRALVVAMLTVLCTGSAFAQIDLRFSPQDSLITTDTDDMRVSVFLDDAVWIRTVELTVTYDTTVVSTVSAGQGDLFSNSSFFIWEGFEEDTPGQWHGFAIVMGATDSLSGPGELFHWNLDAIDAGSTAITAIEAKLYDPSANLIADVNLAAASLTVILGVNAVEDIPRPQTALTLSPNPFNPRTRVAFELPRESQVELTVYDARGRLVTNLFQGLVPAGPMSVAWDGRDSRGGIQPGGVYLFRLVAPGMEPALTKGVLLK
jgi:hypothetical protein